MLKRTEIKGEFYRKVGDSRKADVWFRSGDQLLEAARFDPDRGQARDITIYEFGEDGLPRSRTDASSARHIGKGWWRLTNPTRIELENGHIERSPAPRHAQLGQTVEAEVDTMHLSIAEIAREVSEVESDGFDATPFRVDYHVRLAEPLACLVLPALVLFFAMGGPPFPGPAQTLLLTDWSQRVVGCGSSSWRGRGRVTSFSWPGPLSSRAPRREGWTIGLSSEHSSASWRSRATCFSLSGSGERRCSKTYCVPSPRAKASFSRKLSGIATD